MILYLHGFRSSPQSNKARLLGQRLASLGHGDYLCPQLPASPQQAIELVLSLVASIPAQQLCIIGSSLGGYYATFLAERLGCRALLINPATTPLLDPERFVGSSTYYHADLPFEFKPEYIAQLQALAVPAISQPQRYALLAATGDEVLDYRAMLAHYPGALQLVINGSDHGIAEFEQYLPFVLAFSGVTVDNTDGVADIKRSDVSMAQ